MRSYSRKRKNNIIIGTLCGVMLLMVVGYAAFASQLNIKGTSGISSNWDIEITNIRGENPYGGDAYDISEPTYTPTTATFNTGLKTPDTDRVYEVEVTNKGTLTGLVTIASLSCGDNDAIGCYAEAFDQKQFNEQWEEINFDDPRLSRMADISKAPNEDAIKEYQQYIESLQFTLAPGEKHYIYVDVYYDDVTSQPENLSANINLELTYEQDGLDSSGIAIPPLPEDTILAYSFSTNQVNLTDKLSSIRKATIDYNTLNEMHFLKHNIENGNVSSNEVCFIKDNVLHCLKPNEYETSKANLLNIFGEDNCNISDDYIGCTEREKAINNKNYIGASADTDGTVHTDYYKVSRQRGIEPTSECIVQSYGSAQCWFGK